MVSKQRVTIDLESLEDLTNELSASELRKVETRFRQRIAKVIRSEGLPVIRANTPNRSGKLRSGYQVRTRKGAIEIGNRQFYWHLQDALSGGPLPRFIDNVVLGIVDREGARLLQELASEIIGERNQ